MIVWVFTPLRGALLRLKATCMIDPTSIQSLHEMETVGMVLILYIILNYVIFGVIQTYFRKERQLLIRVSVLGTFPLGYSALKVHFESIL